MSAQSRDHHSPPNSSLEQQLATAQVHSLIQQIYSRHCLLEIELADHASAYQTAIVETVPEQDYLVLDQLVPTAGNDFSLPQAVAIRTRLDNLDIRFLTSITHRAGEQDSRYYKARYPTHIDYPQRREDYRAPVPLDRVYRVEFSDLSRVANSAELRDLSPSGFSARLALESSTNELVGATTRVSITIADGESIEATAAIRHVQNSANGRHQHVGAYFVDLDARTERLLERYAARLERERARLR